MRRKDDRKIPPARGATGFTILEILIATAILTLGLVGILALFPIAIDTGRKVMERSTAVTIAKSVAEQIREGIRNQKRYNFRGAVPFSYFVFRHDGVQGPIPRNHDEERPFGDYYILLPQFQTGRSFGEADGSTEEARREKAVEASTEFVYPEDDEPANGSGNPFRADNDGNDLYEITKKPEHAGQIVVKKVYTLGSLLPDDANTRKLREEQILDDQKADPLKQYSYAFSIRASKFDTNVAPTSAGRIFMPGNNLYHVRVMIFRSFTYNEEKVQAEGKGPEPIYEIDFEVAR